MRRTFWSWAIIAIAALAPATVLAGEKEDKATAEQIATYLRDSGKMQKYSVGVKYRHGTVWLSGRVANEQQMQTALDVISDIEGIEQIVNNLAVAPGSSVRQASASRPSARRTSVVNPDMSIEVPANAGAMQEMMPASQEAVPTGYHKLAAKRACALRQSAARLRAGTGQRGSGSVRPAAYAQLCLAQLRGFSKLRGCDLPQTVFGLGVSVHRPLLSLSASSVGMAQGESGMG